jgi:predicted phage baseplate assembly protein
MSGELRWEDLIVAGDARRDEIRERHSNGVEGVEVREGGRRLLLYFLRHAPEHVHPGTIRIDPPPGARHVRATAVRRVDERDRELEDHLIVELDRRGGGGAYTLRLVEPAADGTPGVRPLRGIDPRYSSARFVFDVDAPLPPIPGAPGGMPAGEYEISYLLRDYQGLRQLMLDRIGVTMPAWSERHIPDPWITLIELLAYVGDDLSYYEDAVATEAYLQTARRRVSVRRHARLVDYRLHEGAAARAWVALEVSAPVALALRRVRFAAVGGLLEARPPLLEERSVPPDTLAALPQYTPLPAHLGPLGREAELVSLRPAHNRIELWSWGEQTGRLAAGATSASLVDGPAGEPPKRVLQLAVGDVLVLEETGDPLTQGNGPADPAHRQAVRLTEVRRAFDELYRQPLLEVRWAAEDALGFELRLIAGGHAISQATGNVLLVSHGVAVDERLELSSPRLQRPGLTFSTPFPNPQIVARHQARALRGLYGRWRREVEQWRREADRGRPLDEEQFELLERQLGSGALAAVGMHGRFEGDDANACEEHAHREASALEELLERADRVLAPRRRRLEVLADLADRGEPLEGVLIHELEADWGRDLTAGLLAGQPGAWGPASAGAGQDPSAALPVLALSDADRHEWLPAADLVDAGPDERVFVAEVDEQQVASLRINSVADTTSLTATYWVGNGAGGNAEAEAINALVWLEPPAGGGGGRQSAAAHAPIAVTAVRNPLPATGGVDTEDVAAARAAIPGSFLQSQPRALTADDYAALASEMPGVGRAAAELRSSGALTIVDVAVQPAVGEDPHPDLLDAVRRELDHVRRINHVVRVLAPRYRPLAVRLSVTVAPTASRAEIAARLARLIGSGWLADGTPAMFHPTRLAFGQTVYPSPIIAAVRDVDGVQAVRLTGLGFAGHAVTATGALKLKALELARLDNDPADPERGYAVVRIEGGR